jgi:hypothetical protein
MSDQKNEIKTSQNGWLAKVAKAYKSKTPVLIVDDANVGIDPSKDTLLSMGKKADLGAKEWTAVAIGVGVAATGAYLLIAAILDPEPFSKVGLAIASGATLLFGGGLSAIRVLTNHKPPHVKITPRGFEIYWD